VANVNTVSTICDHFKLGFFEESREVG